jgi:hypothetical protein
VLPEPVGNFATLLNAESGPDLSGVSQVATVVVADQDRAQITAGRRRRSPTTDHEFLPMRAFGF